MPLKELTVGEVIELLQQYPTHHTVAVSVWDDAGGDDSVEWVWATPAAATEVMPADTGEPCVVVIR